MTNEMSPERKEQIARAIVGDDPVSRVTALRIINAVLFDLAEHDGTEAQLVCYEAYQVVGSLLSDLGKFGTPEAEKILDNLSQTRLVHKDVLPWPSYKDGVQEVPRDVHASRPLSEFPELKAALERDIAAGTATVTGGVQEVPHTDDHECGPQCLGDDYIERMDKSIQGPFRTIPAGLTPDQISEAMIAGITDENQHGPHEGLQEVPQPCGAEPAWIDLTDEDRDAAFNSMPNMLDGFMKLWGWLHFAKAIEQKVREKNAHLLATPPVAGEPRCTYPACTCERPDDGGCAVQEVPRD